MQAVHADLNARLASLCALDLMVSTMPRNVRTTLAQALLPALLPAMLALATLPVAAQSSNADEGKEDASGSTSSDAQAQQDAPAKRSEEQDVAKTGDARAYPARPATAAVAGPAGHVRCRRISAAVRLQTEHLIGAGGAALAGVTGHQLAAPHMDRQYGLCHEREPGNEGHRKHPWASAISRPMAVSWP